MHHTTGSKRLRRWSPVILGLALWPGPFASRLATADTPSTQAATKPALSSDFCTISDYCTVVLAPKVQDVLGATDAQRATFVKERDRLEIMMSGQTGRGPSGAAGATMLLGAARRSLEVEGQRIRDLLTLEQDKKLQDLFAKRNLKPIEIQTAKSNIPGRAGASAGQIEIIYTHYNGPLTTAPAGAKSDTAATAATAPKPATPAAPPANVVAIANTPPVPPAPIPTPVAPGAPLAAAFSARIQDAIAGKTYRAGSAVGGAFAQDFFEDIDIEGGILVGFRINKGKFVNNETVGGIQPIFLNAKGQSSGRLHGKASTAAVEIVAKPGYAVGAISVGGGANLDALSVTFMRITADGKLNPQDSYTSDKVGGAATTMIIGGDGTAVIGIAGKEDDEKGSLALALVFLAPTPTSRGVKIK